MATANFTPTHAWGQILQASADMEGGVSCRWADMEIATNRSATAPAESVEGHFVPRRHTEPVKLKSGDRLWGRIANTVDDGTSDAPATGVHTFQAT